MNNLFASLPDSSEEIFETLLCAGRLKLERIVSSGQSTPPGEWLCQDEHEWVVVLRGQAVLQFQGEAQSRSMGPGDYALIPARTAHRVESTAVDQKTVWLALHYA